MTRPVWYLEGTTDEWGFARIRPTDPADLRLQIALADKAAASGHVDRVPDWLLNAAVADFCGDDEAA